MKYISPRFSQHSVQESVQRYRWMLDNIPWNNWRCVAGVDTIYYTFTNKEDFLLFMFRWGYDNNFGES